MSPHQFAPIWLRRLLSAPYHELSRWQRGVRFLVELSRQGVRQLRQDRATQMAAALAFRTLFGMIPVLAIGMVLFKSFGGLDRFQELVHELLMDLGLNEVRVVERMGPVAPEEKLVVDDVGPTTPAGPTSAENLDPSEETAGDTAGGPAGNDADAIAGAGGPAAGVTDGDAALGGGADKIFVDETGELLRPLPGPTLVEWIDGILAQVQRLDLTSIGLIGIIALIWAAIGLLTTIERSFNIVCRAPDHRPFSRRLPLYWTTITLGPVLIYMSFYANNQFADFYRGLAQGSITNVMVGIVGAVSSFFVAWLFFFILYALMPNTRMRMTAVAVGSLFGAVLWQLGNGLLTSYLAFAFTSERGVSIVYASLGLIPVFMIWVYVMWLVILFGLEVASAMQTLGRRRRVGVWPDRIRTPSIVDPLVVLPVMEELAIRFAAGRTATAEQMAKATNINRRSIELLLGALVERGLLHIVDVVAEKKGRNVSTAEAYALARPPERIRSDELIQIAQELAEGPEAEFASAEAVAARARGDDSEPALDPEAVPMHNQIAAWETVQQLRRLVVQQAGGRTLAELRSENGSTGDERPVKSGPSRAIAAHAPNGTVGTKGALKPGDRPSDRTTAGEPEQATAEPPHP